MSIDGDHVYVTWKDSVPGNDNIYFAASSDRAKSFNEATKVAESSFGIPNIVSSGNNVYLLWQDGDYGNVDIYLKTSQDNGLSFGDTVIMGQKYGFLEPLVSASGKNLFIAWIERTVNGSSLKLNISNDGGATFLDNTSLINGITAGNNPQILSSNNNVYVSWINSSGIFFKASTDSGNQFDDSRKLVRNSESEVAFFPALLSVNDNVYVVWKQLYISGDSEIGNKILFMSGKVSGDSSSSSAFFG